MRSRIALRALSFCGLVLYSLVGVAQDYLYKATLVQAAPGKIVELMDVYKGLRGQLQAGGDEPFFWMRHSQGDRWDLLVLFPAGNYSDYYKPERIAKREKVWSAVRQKLQDDIAWQEDVFVYGPPLAEVRKAFEGAGFFHVEMFQALAGKQGDLFRQRQMENDFSRRLGLTENLIFVRDQGAAWDVFTIGCYRDLKHYAASGDVPNEQQEAAARAAGFAGAGDIGPYLRRFIASHHDTLAVAVR